MYRIKRFSGYAETPILGSSYISNCNVNDNSLISKTNKNYSPRVEELMERNKGLMFDLEDLKDYFPKK